MDGALEDAGAAEDDDEDVDGGTEVGLRRGPEVMAALGSTEGPSPASMRWPEAAAAW